MRAAASPARRRRRHRAGFSAATSRPRSWCAPASSASRPRSRVVLAWEHLDPELALAQARRVDAASPKPPLARPAGGREGHHRHRRPAHRLRLADPSRPPAGARRGLRGGLRERRARVILGQDGDHRVRRLRAGEDAQPARSLRARREDRRADRPPRSQTRWCRSALGTQTAGVDHPPGRLLRRRRAQAHARAPSPRRCRTRSRRRWIRSGSSCGRSRCAASARGASPGARRCRAGRQPGLRFCRTEPGRARRQTRRAVENAAAGRREGGRAWTSFAGLVRRADRDHGRGAHRALQGKPRIAVEPRLRQFLQDGANVSPDRLRAAHQQAERARREVDAIFEDLDALLTPAVVGEAPEGLDATGDPIFSRIWTLLGTPCVSLPVLSGPAGLPVGLQVVGPRSGERAGCWEPRAGFWAS